MSSFVIFAAIGFGSLGLFGCSDGVGNVVTGTVKMKNGDPVLGTIVFKGSSKEAKTTIANGKYTVEHVEAGMNKITIFAIPGMNVDAGTKDKKETPKDAGTPGITETKSANPPKKYETGGVPDFDVKAGKNSGPDIVLDPS